MNNPQLELGLGARINHTSTSPKNRNQRAAWWFARMRQIVDLATEWQPDAVPLPEQIYFPHAYRPGPSALVKTSPKRANRHSGNTEHQVAA